jgi:hypothetical protein
MLNTSKLQLKNFIRDPKKIIKESDIDKEHIDFAEKKVCVQHHEMYPQMVLKNNIKIADYIEKLILSDEHNVPENILNLFNKTESDKMIYTNLSDYVINSKKPLQFILHGDLPNLQDSGTKILYNYENNVELCKKRTTYGYPPIFESLQHALFKKNIYLYDVSCIFTEQEYDDYLNHPDNEHLHYINIIKFCENIKINIIISKEMLSIPKDKEYLYPWFKQVNESHIIPECYVETIDAFLNNINISNINVETNFNYVCYSIKNINIMNDIPIYIDLDLFSSEQKTDIKKLLKKHNCLVKNKTPQSFKLIKINENVKKIEKEPTETVNIESKIDEKENIKSEIDDEVIESKNIIHEIFKIKFCGDVINFKVSDEYAYIVYNDNSWILIKDQAYYAVNNTNQLFSKTSEIKNSNDNEVIFFEIGGIEKEFKINNTLLFRYKNFILLNGEAHKITNALEFIE